MAELDDMEAEAIEAEMGDMAPASTYIAPVASDPNPAAAQPAAAQEA